MTANGVLGMRPGGSKSSFIPGMSVPSISAMGFAVALKTFATAVESGRQAYSLLKEASVGNFGGFRRHVKQANEEGLSLRTGIPYR